MALHRSNSGSEAFDGRSVTALVRETDMTTETLTLIGLAGRKGHGKDTAAAGLTGYENVKFAGPLKAMLRTFMEYVGLPAETIDRCIEGDMKEVPMPCFGGKTTRFAMQTLGTEWGRNTISDSLWVNAFHDRATQFDKVVCSDMRFPNEVQFIKDMGGTTVRIVDPRKSQSTDDHPSETAIDSLPVDYVVMNEHGILDLEVAVRSIAATAEISL